MARVMEFDTDKFAGMLMSGRMAAGLSLRELAVLIGVSSATLSRIERGAKPDIDTFVKVCHWAKWKKLKMFFVDSELKREPPICLTVGMLEPINRMYK